MSLIFLHSSVVTAKSYQLDDPRRFTILILNLVEDTVIYFKYYMLSYY